MSGEHTAKVGALVGYWLGIIVGLTVSFGDIGADDGIKVGEEVGFAVVGDLEGLYDGFNEGANVGIGTVGAEVGVLVLGYVWHIEGDTAVHRPLYILLFPDIATQSLPAATTGYEDRQNEVNVGTVPS